MRVVFQMQGFIFTWWWGGGGASILIRGGFEKNHRMGGGGTLPCPPHPQQWETLFTRVRCAMMSSKSLYDIHTALCHPVATQLIKSRNLPYSIKNVKQVCKECCVCQEIKPIYCQPNKIHLMVTNCN